MPTQLERMRAPMLRMGIRGMSTGMRGGASDEQRRAAMGAGQTGAPMGTNGLPMDVVYDQQPEQFEKKLKLERENLALRRDDNAMLNSIRQQDAESRSQRAQSYEDSVNKRMDEAAKIMQQYANQMGIEGFRGQNRKDIAGMNNASREGIASNTLTSRENIAAAAQQGADRRNAVSNATRRELGVGDDTLSPSQQSQEITNRAQAFLNANPDAARMLTVAPNGDVTVAPNQEIDGAINIEDKTLRDKIMQEVYGNNGSVNRSPGFTSGNVGAAFQSGNRGVGSASVGTNVGGLGMPVTGELTPGGVLAAQAQVRARAEQALRNAGKPVTEANVQALMRQRR